MAVDISVADLAEALRLGDTAEETAQVTRLLAFTTEVISKHLGNQYTSTPEVILNEAAIRMSGYLFDKPYASGGISFADALRFSGAGAILLPYRLHRAGTTAG